MGQGWYTGPSHRHAVASVKPGHGWNPLLQPELDGSHMKQTQLMCRWSRYHKAQHSLESFEWKGSTFLEGDRVALNCQLRGMESLSEKKAIRKRREARLKLSQWEQSVPLRAESAWNFPKHVTHSAWASSACRGDLQVLQSWRGICKNAVKFALLVRLFGSTPDGCRGWPSLQAGRFEVLIQLLEAFQWQIPASAESQRRREFVAEGKKSKMWWQVASYTARRPSHFGGLWRPS